MTIVARKTLDAIDAAMRRDGGASYRQALAVTLPECTDAYRGEEQRFREHLGASLSGRSCARSLFYSFRWAAREELSPQIMRLFNRGHLEEGRFLALMMIIGIKVQAHDPNTGKQWRFSECGGHYGGSLDAMLYDVPDLPGVVVDGEFKTHNEKNFEKLIAEGLHQAKFDHYVQMQIGMRKRSLDWGLYLAVHKDSDRLHGELVPLNADIADRYTARAHSVITNPVPPDKINKSASWWGCKFCEHRQVCHKGAAPERNCRTCVNASPVDGGWACALANGQHIPVEVQRTGCQQYAVAAWVGAK